MAEESTRAWKDQYMLRFPDGMRDRIKLAAEANGRSMNGEIIHRLQTTFEMDSYKPSKNVGPTYSQDEIDRLLLTLSELIEEYKKDD